VFNHDAPLVASHLKVVHQYYLGIRSVHCVLLVLQLTLFIASSAAVHLL